MSSNSKAVLFLASQLKKIAGAHQAKVPVNQVTDSEARTETRTGSEVQVGEGGDEIDPPQRPGKSVRIEDDETLARVSKKQRVAVEDPEPLGEQHDQANLEVSGSGAGGSQAAGKKKSVFKVGVMSIRELGEMASQIPDDKDWLAMEKIDMADHVEKQMAAWGHIGMLLDGARVKANAQKDKIQELSELLAERDELLVEKYKAYLELKDKLAATDDRITELEGELGQAGDRIATVEAQSGILKKRVIDLEAVVDSHWPEEEIVTEFKESDEYSEALAGAAAEKLHRCWIVTKKLIITDPNSSFDKFCDNYVAAEMALAETGLEPTPYESPNPLFVQTRTDAPPPPPDGQPEGVPPPPPENQ